jgi:hypothetical protein
MTKNAQNLLDMRNMVFKRYDVGALDTGVSQSTFSWATSTAQLRPRSAMKIKEQQGRPS